MNSRRFSVGYAQSIYTKYVYDGKGMQNDIYSAKDLMYTLVLFYKCT